MLHVPAMRVFTLRPEGVRCGATVSLSDPFRCCVVRETPTVESIGPSGD